MDEFSSIIRNDPDLARRLARLLQELEGGAVWQDALASAGVSEADASHFVNALRKQLEKETAKKHRTQSVGTITAFADGGSRGNPGQAACAVILYDDAGEELLRRGKRLGRMTNNAAEYEGVLLALELARQLGARRLDLRLDSELVVKQIQGGYKVRHETLKPYHARVMKLAAGFDAFDVSHVKRADNARADALVNATLDGREE